ncbi:hypothetical protein K3495_g1423 [Podosphaera aphanis]|nr:hypothetical protein K3495_g1423 [Podosphaera aphanis]
MTRQKLGHSGYYRGTRGWNKSGPKENGRTFGSNGATKDRKYREQVEETDEELQARQLYYSWKKMIKEYPKPNDRSTIKNLWRKSLEILDNRDLNMIQQIPRDLESVEYQGFNHINAIMGIQAREGESEEFINLALPFLQVITHEAILDNLAVDTAVGGIYNYISGTNGIRVTTFFQRLCQCIVNLKAKNLSVSSLDQIMISILNTLREVLKRERRASYNEDLPEVFNQIERIMKITGLENDSATNQIVNAGIVELRGIVTRAHKLLQIDSGIHTPESSTVVASMYSRENARYPRHLHNNDKLDINEMQILPTSEEIQSEHADFLPSTSFDEAHFLQDKAQRHIDTHFRLLRHDIFGQLKETLGGLIFAVRRNPALLKNPRLGLENNFRANIYPDTKLVRIIFQRRELEAQISVPNPPSLRNKSNEQKSRWWEESRRLEEGVLLCLLSFCDAKCSLLFLIASKKNLDRENNKFSPENSKTIMATLASKNEENLQTLIEIHGAEIGTNHNFLIELPNVIPATFIPVLECLQRMYRSNRLPFRDWILPDSIEPLIAPLPILIVPPPLYARSENFRYSLKPILKDPDGEDILVDPQTALRNEDLLKRILSSTLLDQGQARAMISALCQEFVQIQGPPGTGKSFLGVKLMQVFLEVSRKTSPKLGPIIVVCYTNHALDQFLEHLMEIGIEKIVRIGGQSKSERLEGKNLRMISKLESKSKGESYTCAMAYRELENHEKEVVKYLISLQNLRSRKGSVWKVIDKYLRRSFPNIHRQFLRIDDEDYYLVGRQPYDLWIQESETHIFEPERSISIEGLLEIAERNAFSLSAIGRQRLHNFWTSELRRELVDNLYGCIERSKKTDAELRKIHNEVDRRVLQNAEIIGVTTSGLARNISTLEHVRAKVMICEEAGEIIEAHYLTSLLPTVEHVMSIGDHMQLRPSINNYNLSLENPKGTPFQLDRSQFERLSIGEPKRPKLPISQLNVQRRMRPAISNLIRGLYRNLIDHESVKDLPNVVGLKDNVFFFDHKNPEDGRYGDNLVHQKSHSNMWEVEMTFALVRHLIRQGEYKTEDIAVLTPYTGQLQKLRALLRNNFEVFLDERDENLLVQDGFLDNDPRGHDVLQTERVPLCKKKISDLLRLATVDNFQGEEAKIVIVSLVRSNTERRVGFLRTTNRINVLLSRAKHGLYLIGNAETYSEVPMWTDVLGILRAQNSVDLLMFRNYDEIDLDETPIVVLNCGHFFTVETLDGMLGMHEVYEIDGNGNFIETKEATELARSIPRCPDCNTAIRQYATKRYNRVVNRAVIDNMSKRFLVEGQDGIARLHEKIKETEKRLEVGRENINRALQDTNPARAHLTIKNLAEFQKKECQRLLKQIKEFQLKVADENQPAKKLFDATIKAAENMRLETKFSKLSIKKPVSLLPRDRRVTVGAQVLELDAKYHMLIDQFLVLKAVKKTMDMSDVFTAKLECSDFFRACKVLFETCRDENLPRRGVDCAIYYGQVAREYNMCNFSTDRTKTQEVVIEAKELLSEARRLCGQPFQGADELAIAIDTILKHLQDQWYEEVTPEEKAAIMAAMVSGSQGIATHSGHWYECARGHPVSFLTSFGYAC